MRPRPRVLKRSHFHESSKSGQVNDNQAHPERSVYAPQQLDKKRRSPLGAVSIALALIAAVQMVAPGGNTAGGILFATAGLAFGIAGAFRPRTQRIASSLWGLALSLSALIGGFLSYLPAGTHH